jgi:hypothetical protein
MNTVARSMKSLTARDKSDYQRAQDRIVLIDARLEIDRTRRFLEANSRMAIVPRAEPLGPREWRGFSLNDWNRVVRGAFRLGALATAAVLEQRKIRGDVELVVTRTADGIAIEGRAGDDERGRSARAWFAASVAQELAGFRREAGEGKWADDENAEALLRAEGRPWGIWQRERDDSQRMLNSHWNAVLAVAEPLLAAGVVPAMLAKQRIERSLPAATRERLRLWS